MADRFGNVQMKALRLFTVNSPTTAVILHGDDREEADVAARYPYVSASDAVFLEKEGYAEPYDGKLPDADDSGETVGDRAARLTEESAEAENSVEATTGLATRSSTAFERPVEELAGQGGARTMNVADATAAPASEEEAPASGKGKTAKAPAKSE
jgi:hypothetical protein